MVGLEGRLRTDASQRLCWRCGYRGRQLQGARGCTTFACPLCGEDLYARPPMSYLEREGFLDISSDHAQQARPPGDRLRVSARRLPTLRFVVSALMLSVVAAATLAVAMAVYAD